MSDRQAHLASLSIDTLQFGSQIFDERRIFRFAFQKVVKDIRLTTVRSKLRLEPPDF